MSVTRRRFVAGSAAAAVAVASSRLGFAADGWRQGDVIHLIPAVNHERLLVKCSVARPRAKLTLKVDDRTVAGQAIDRDGRYFAFDVAQLAADHRYRLQLIEANGTALTDPWPLTTFPVPDSRVDFVRLLAFTCAGGYPDYPNRAEQPFLSLPLRQRLLARALSFEPNAMIAIGDHIYLDQRTQLESSRSAVRERAAEFYGQLGRLNLTEPAQTAANESGILNAVKPQIAGVYGTALRSTPSYFVGDDHDYFENDEAWPGMVTLPPYRYQLALGRHVRNLFLPEFLPDPARPQLMSGAGAGDRQPGIGESYGTFRYGRLAEAVIYDCARFLSLKGEAAGLVAPEAERWLLERTTNQDVRHLFHVPSHPFGWSAGKWREWYPDVADVGDADKPAVAQSQIPAGEQFRLTTERSKFMWQPGWWRQHQRLLAALAGQRNRAGIVLSGDLHATGHAMIRRSGALDFDANPVHAILTGPLGTGTGWPSRSRGTPPVVASELGIDSLAPVSEKNGFTLLDVAPNEVRVRLFAWRRGEPEDTIDRLEPYHSHIIERRTRA